MLTQNNYVGNYRIVQKISSGAFGQVYLANHAVLSNRIVAIKLLHATHLSSQQEITRFFKEAQFLEKLKHPHILPIIDVGAHEGFPYLVTEYAPGGSLRDAMNYYSPRLLPLGASLSILIQIADALQYAHRQGVIHRDLKPENILFDGDGKVLLADFGLATTLSTQSVKETGLMGTFAYMAPEQFQSLICKESDQYALGCIAYELFTGHLPFEVKDIATLIAQRLQQEAPPPKHHNPYLFASINSAIAKALSKDRARRHKDMRAFIKAFSIPSTRLSDEERMQRMIEFAAITGTSPDKKLKLIEVCDQVINLDPYFDGAYFCKGVALSDLRRYEEALIALTIATQLDPNGMYNWYYKGEAHEYLGQMVEARQAYTIAQQLKALIEQEEDDDDEEEDDETEEEYEGEDINLFDSEDEDEEEDYGSEAYDEDIDFEDDGDSSDEDELADTPVALKAVHTAKKDSERWYEQGLTFKQLGHLEEALQAFDKALQLNPKHVAAWNEKGDAYFGKGQPQEAIDAFMQALELNPYYIPSLLALAALLYLSSAYEEALTGFENVLSLDPANVQAWIGRGDTLLSLERYDEALSSCEQALKLEPVNVLAHVIKGRALKELGKYQEALTTYDVAIKLQGGQASDYSAAYTNKGNILHSLGTDKEALESFVKALQWDPENAMALIGKGNALRGLKRYHEALEAHEQAIKVFPDYTLAYCNKGNVLYDLERYEEAIQAYNKVIQIDPKHANAYYGKGNVLWKQKRHSEALSAYNKALTLNPNNAYIHWGKGNVFFELGLIEEALVAFDQAIQLSPRETLFHFMKGFILQQRHRYGEALASFETCLQINPNDVNAHIQKGIALFFLRRPNEALQILEKYTPLVPDNALAWCIKGDLQYMAGNPRVAIASYDQALRKEPEFPNALRNRALVLLELDERAEAFKALQLALHYLPDDPKLHEEFGHLLLKYSRFADALPYFDRAIQLNPNFDMAYRGKITVLQLLSLYDQALNAIEVALRRFPDTPFFWSCKGVTLKGMGKPREAAKAFKKAEQLEKSQKNAVPLTKLTSLDPGREESITLGHKVMGDAKGLLWQKQLEPHHLGQSFAATEPIKIFCCYAFEDEKFRDEILQHLNWSSPTIWYDCKIPLKTDWHYLREKYLNEAHIVLLLVSSDFMRSNYLNSLEIHRIMEKHSAGKTYVIPVILRLAYGYWGGGNPISSLLDSHQVLPTNAKSITDYPDRNRAFEDVAQGIQRVIQRVIQDHLNSSQQKMQPNKLLPLPSESKVNSQPLLKIETISSPDLAEECD